VPFILEQLDEVPRLTREPDCSRRWSSERGYTGGPDHFRRVVGRLRPKRPAEAFQRLRTLPGEQAQVDWAHFGKLTIGRASAAAVGIRDGAQLLAAHLPPVLSRRLDAVLLRGHVEAFAEIGGVARVVLYDNLKSAVVERHGDAIRFHPTLLALAAHYRFEPRPVAVARGNEKGRVERAIRYVRDASSRRVQAIRDLADLNRQAAEWTTGPAA
jgi:transposase